MFTRFDTIDERNEQQTDGRTDRRTDTARQHRPRLCIASRRKTFRRTPTPTVPRDQHLGRPGLRS